MSSYCKIVMLQVCKSNMLGKMEKRFTCLQHSTDFCVSDGVKQGAVISPLLFSNYMDALFKILKSIQIM